MCPQRLLLFFFHILKIIHINQEVCGHSWVQYEAVLVGEVDRTENIMYCFMYSLLGLQLDACLDKSCVNVIHVVLDHDNDICHDVVILWNICSETVLNTITILSDFGKTWSYCNLRY